MALILITLQDTPEGAPTVRLLLEPRILEGTPEADLSHAQRLAGAAMNAIQKALEQQSNIIVIDAAKFQ